MQEPQRYVFDVSGDTGEHLHQSGTTLGFWIFLMSDCLVFGVLFAVYAVLGGNYAAGPSPADLFDLEMVLVSTLVLLVSSAAYSLSVLYMYRNSFRIACAGFVIAGFSGIVFAGLGFLEFRHLYGTGATPGASAFLSSFYVLVGTHGIHVLAGVIWLVTLLVQISVFGFTEENRGRIICLGAFWHFLDLIWIGVFSVVYLAGVL